MVNASDSVSKRMHGATHGGTDIDGHKYAVQHDHQIPVIIDFRW
jgi:hypothetical protein